MDSDILKHCTILSTIVTIETHAKQSPRPKRLRNISNNHNRTSTRSLRQVQKRPVSLDALEWVSARIGCVLDVLCSMPKKRRKQCRGETKINADGAVVRIENKKMRQC